MQANATIVKIYDQEGCYGMAWYYEGLCSVVSSYRVWVAYSPDTTSLSLNNRVGRPTRRPTIQNVTPE